MQTIECYALLKEQLKQRSQGRVFIAMALGVSFGSSASAKSLQRDFQRLARRMGSVATWYCYSCHEAMDTQKRSTIISSKFAEIPASGAYTDEASVYIEEAELDEVWDT
jgi:hypothetical protein